MRCYAQQRVDAHLLHYTSSFWEAYPDLPKFAYLHLFEAHLARHITASHDAVLARFLRQMMAPNAAGAANTVLVLLGDHGLANCTTH